MAKLEVIYSDINLYSGVETNELVLNAESLNQNIGCIFETPKKSRWFRPRVGSDVQRHLFDPVDSVTASRIKYDMERALEDNNEGRLVFDNISVIPDPENAQYFVDIRYRAPALESHQFTFQFNLSRGFS